MPRTAYTDHVGVTRAPTPTLENPCSCKTCKPESGRTYGIHPNKEETSQRVTRTPDQIGISVFTPWVSKVRA